jgi:hypothetical protein
MTPRLLGTVTALAGTVIMVALSHAPVSTGGDDSAVIRVSWSARPERVEICRRVSDEELSKIAEHMRRRVSCEGTTARYHYEILRNDVPIDSGTVRGGGLRHDREVYMARERPVPPGKSRIGVRFVRLDSSTAIAADNEERKEREAREERGEPSREDDERRRRRAEAIPPVLTIDTTISLAPRAVVLVTYDALARRLVLKGRP